MTPKEKAIELFNKMDMIIYTDQDNWKSQCIRCALIAVDEIRNILSMPNIPKYYPIVTDEYWEQVKQEIEKL
jgi:hypothetical protein